LFVLALVVLMVGAGFLITALQSRGAESALEKSLEKRIDNIVTALDDPAGKLPLTESYAQVIDRLGQVKDLSPAIGKDEFLLTSGQLKFVADQGRLRIDKEIKALGGRSTLLAETRRAAKTAYIIVVGAPRDQAAAATRRLVTTLVFAGLALGTLLGLGGWLMAGAALRPVRRMAEKAAQISAADLGQRVLNTDDEGDRSPKKMPAELAHLGNTLDDMLERLDDSFRRERAFVDDASHELRTPLAIVRGELELALLHPGDAEETRATLTSSLQQVTRLGVMADDLLVLARAGVNRRPPSLIDAGAVTDSLLARLRPQLRTDVRIERERTGDHGGPPAAIRPADLERIITNLVTNAARAAKSVVRITLRAHAAATTIVVSDDGPGFAPDLLEHAFERFVVGSASRTGSGTGLGLAIVAALTEAADGAVTVINGGTLGGAEVTVVLPAVLVEPK
jgi:two-component system, OmpR family, sensor kinase